MAQPAKQTQAEKLANDIADAILSGVMSPGSRLDEHMLAARYDVSRTPVREAIRHLASTGLVELRPRRSAIVTKVSPEQLETMFIAMGELEATCARLSAMRMTSIERRRLQTLHEGMAQIVRDNALESFADANQAFHSLIYDGAHNSILSELAIGLRRRLGPYRRAQFRSPGRLPRSQAEHEAIMLAIVSGDTVAAHAAMLHHVSLVEDSFRRLAEAHAA